MDNDKNQSEQTEILLALLVRIVKIEAAVDTISAFCLGIMTDADNRQRFREAYADEIMSSLKSLKEQFPQYERILDDHIEILVRRVKEADS